MAEDKVPLGQADTIVSIMVCKTKECFILQP